MYKSEFLQKNPKGVLLCSYLNLQPSSPNDTKTRLVTTLLQLIRYCLSMYHVASLEKRCSTYWAMQELETRLGSLRPKGQKSLLPNILSNIRKSFSYDKIEKKIRSLRESYLLNPLNPPSSCPEEHIAKAITALNDQLSTEYARMQTSVQEILPMPLSFYAEALTDPLLSPFQRALIHTRLCYWLSTSPSTPLADIEGRCSRALVDKNIFLPERIKTQLTKLVFMRVFKTYIETRLAAEESCEKLQLIVGLETKTLPRSNLEKVPFFKGENSFQSQQKIYEKRAKDIMGAWPPSLQVFLPDLTEKKYR